MKVLKKAKQQNVLLDKDYYTEYQQTQMLDNKEVGFLDEELNICYDRHIYLRNFCEDELRIFLDQGDELKVVLNKYGYYTTAVIKNGKQYFIKL